MNRWLTSLFVVGITLGRVGFDTWAADSTPEQRQAPTAVEIRGWIRDLSSNRFEVREAATRRLEKSGSGAVQLLSDAAEGESLEVTCRSIRALEAIADRSDVVTFEASQSVLERLAESTNRSVARRAEFALRGLSGARRRHALARINELGAIVKALSTPDGIIVPDDEDPPAVQIILDKHWKGGDAGLVHLRRIDGLQGLIIARGTPVSEEALDELKRDLSPLQIQLRGEAMLGVMCTNLGADVVVNRIAPGSAAQKAGLEEGDTIVKYDGEEIPVFDRLIEVTKNRSAGDKVVIEIVRDGKPMKLEAVLTGWRQ